MSWLWRLPTLFNPIKVLRGDNLYKSVLRIFEGANNKFLEQQKKFIISGVSERSLCGQLMSYIDKEKSDTSFSSYYVDVEYNRNRNDRIKTIKNSDEKIINVTCDIIFHSRGENLKQDNLIAIEMKKSNQPVDRKNQDRERLRALTKETFGDIWSYDGKTLPKHVCRYLLGVFYEINIHRNIVEVEYYMKGELWKKHTTIF